MSDSPDYIVREVDGSSVEVLCALFGQVFHQDIGPEVWRWKYQDQALSGQVNVALHKGERLLGHAGAVIMPGVFDGRPAPMAQICDVMLSPEARGGAGPHGAYAAFMAGLILALRRHIPEGMFYGFPGVRPFRLGERLGLYRGTGRIFEYRRPARRDIARHWRLIALDWDDARIDRLWHARALRSGCRLVRDRRYLGWRYARNPLREYRLLGVRAGLRLAGWVVVQRDGDALRIVDRLIDESDLGRVLNAVSGLAYSLGCGLLAWWQGMAGAEPPAGACAYDTGMIGVVLPSSAPVFADCVPYWQPGDTDVL